MSAEFCNFVVGKSGKDILWLTGCILVFQGMQYLNKMVIPKVMEGYGKCKVVVEKAINKSMELTKVGVQKVKVWYAENKEKTIEELYLEAYMLANSSVFKAADQLKLKSKEMKLKLKEFRLKMMELKANLTQTFNQRLEIWNSTITKNLEIWNTTVMDITKELVSVYNQTAEVTVIAGRQLVVVFRPCFKILKGKTVAYLVEMKNLTLPLVEKARNFTLLQLEKAKSYSVEVYKNVTSCQKFKTFVAKYEIKQKVNRSLEYVKKVYQKVVKFVEESRPKIEAKMREAIFYVNVTLPKLMEKKRAEYKLKFLELKQKYHGKFLEMKRQCVERCEKLKLKYREIVANPKMFAEKIYNKVSKDWKVDRRPNVMLRANIVKESYIASVWITMQKCAKSFQHPKIKLVAPSSRETFCLYYSVKHKV